MLWGLCISALVLLPRLLRVMLQSLQVSRICREELPVVAQLLRLLMQHGQLRSHMMTNEFLVQQIIKDIMVRNLVSSPRHHKGRLHVYVHKLVQTLHLVKHKLPFCLSRYCRLCCRLLLVWAPVLTAQGRQFWCFAWFSPGGLGSGWLGNKRHWKWVTCTAWLLESCPKIRS